MNESVFDCRTRFGSGGDVDIGLFSHHQFPEYDSNHSRNISRDSCRIGNLGICLFLSSFGSHFLFV